MGQTQLRKEQIKIGSVKATRSTSQSIPNSVITPMEFTSEEFDTHGFHDNSTNNSRLTVPTGMAGKYIVVGSAGLNSGYTGRRALLLSKNGTQEYQQEWANPGTAYATFMNISGIFDLSEGDYIEMPLYQSSGVSLGTTGVYQSLSMIKIA